MPDEQRFPAPLSLTDAASEWALRYPEAAKFFDRLGLDYGCGGKSLRTLCVAADLNPQAVFSELTELLGLQPAED